STKRTISVANRHGRDKSRSPWLLLAIPEKPSHQQVNAKTLVSSASNVVKERDDMGSGRRKVAGQGDARFLRLFDISPRIGILLESFPQMTTCGTAGLQRGGFFSAATRGYARIQPQRRTSAEAQKSNTTDGAVGDVNFDRMYFFLYQYHLSYCRKFRISNAYMAFACRDRNSPLLSIYDFSSLFRASSQTRIQRRIFCFFHSPSDITRISILPSIPFFKAVPKHNQPSHPVSPHPTRIINDPQLRLKMRANWPVSFLPKLKHTINSSPASPALFILPFASLLFYEIHSPPKLLAFQLPFFLFFPASFNLHVTA
ncbi:hypothetical protein L249_1354, partial [Ophiocordyceps polyrhachis-furcata BCC 54312]